MSDLKQQAMLEFVALWSVSRRNDAEWFRNQPRQLKLAMLELSTESLRSYLYRLQREHGDEVEFERFLKETMEVYGSESVEMPDAYEFSLRIYRQCVHRPTEQLDLNKIRAGILWNPRYLKPILTFANILNPFGRIALESFPDDTPSVDEAETAKREEDKSLKRLSLIFHEEERNAAMAEWLVERLKPLGQDEQKRLLALAEQDAALRSWLGGDTCFKIVQSLRCKPDKTPKEF